MATEEERTGYFRDRDKKLESLVDGSANDRQVGGRHYREASPEFQHWDLMAENHAGYFEGQITKYVTRWRNKGGLQDLEKAGHYLQKLIELVTDGKLEPPCYHAVSIRQFCVAHSLGKDEADIFSLVIGFDSVESLNTAKEILEQLIARA